MAPPNIEYAHEKAWHDGNGHSHVQAALMGPAVVLAVRNGSLKLGTWQQVVAYTPKATVQEATGAVPLAVGVASGEVILAVAVLAILVTAPAGAIGIMMLGEKILDRGERSSYRFKELRESLGLPRVGERIRSKEFDTVWKVIE